MSSREQGPPATGGALASPNVVTTHEHDVDSADLWLGDTYLGTLPDLADPCDLLPEFEPDRPEDAYGPAEFRAAAERLLGRMRGSSSWPWPYASSASTPWAYRWAGNAVQVWRRGNLYAVLYPTHARPRQRVRPAPFPQMTTQSDESAEPSPAGNHGE